MKRGDVVTITLQGDFGKPRPAVVVQADAFNETHATFTVLLISGTQVDAPLFRLGIESDAGNGLGKPSQIQVDKIMTVRRERIVKVIGHLGDADMLRINRALAVWIGLA